MQTIGGVLRTLDQEIHLGWRHVRSWVGSTFTRERTTEIVFASFTLTLFALLLFDLYKAVHSFTIVSLSPSLSSMNWRLAVPGY